MAALWVLTAIVSFGAELDVTAGVDRTTVALGERLLLTVTATGPNVSGLPQPRLPRSADFTNHGSMWGRFTSDSGAGDKTRQQTVGFVYTLEPKRTGTLTIGPVSFTHEGTIHQTQPIVVHVVAAGTELHERSEDAEDVAGVVGAAVGFGHGGRRCGDGQQRQKRHGPARLFKEC